MLLIKEVVFLLREQRLAIGTQHHVQPILTTHHGGVWHEDEAPCGHHSLQLLHLHLLLLHLELLSEEGLIVGILLRQLCRALLLAVEQGLAELVELRLLLLKK